MSKKYDINAENNTPQILYGVPDFIRKEMEEKKEAEKQELSFKDMLFEKEIDPFWADLVVNYFKDELKVDDDTARSVYNDLSEFEDIYSEFTKYLVQRTYDLSPKLEINGYTAQKLHEEVPALMPSDVYTILALFRKKPKDAEKMLNDLKKKYNLETMNNITQAANYKLHAEQLSVPVLDDFHLVNDDNPQIIFTAMGHGYIEQLVSDGHIEDDDFENRIDLVIKNVKEYMKANNFEDVDKSFIYYKDYDNGVFKFKLYFQDMIRNEGDNKKIMRTLYAFFVEPNFHDFYQFSLGTGQFDMPTKMLKPGVIDLENDQVTRAIDKLMQGLLENIKYKKQNKEKE